MNKDILTLIALLIPPTRISTIFSLAKVNRFFNQLIDSNKFWKTYYQHYLPKRFALLTIKKVSNWKRLFLKDFYQLIKINSTTVKRFCTFSTRCFKVVGIYYEKELSEKIALFYVFNSTKTGITELIPANHRSPKPINHQPDDVLFATDFDDLEKPLYIKIYPYYYKYRLPTINLTKISSRETPAEEEVVCRFRKGNISQNIGGPDKNWMSRFSRLDRSYFKIKTYTLGKKIRHR